MFFLVLKQYPNVCMAIGALFTFAITFFFINKFMDKLPADEGRDFAVEGKLSKGKPRGAGFIFVLCFILGVLLFGSLFKMATGYMAEILIYLLLIFVEMITGFLDDKADKPWGRVKKGLFDLGVSILLAITYIYSNGTTINFLTYELNLPVWLMAVVIIFMCFLSINVTNCADGVDGLSSTLVITTLISFLIADVTFRQMHGFRYLLVFFVAALLGYLWYNAGPSILMMGDAGSRAMGIFIWITALKSGHMFLFIPFALVIILDGGYGLFKILVIKITKKKDFMSKLRAPLHDHVRKNLTVNWANNQCVTRFFIIQMVISIATVYLFCR